MGVGQSLGSAVLSGGGAGLQKVLSLGVATWVYGHEPFNRFTAWDAKLFSNAVREDILLAILNNGVIIAPGAAGTRQEIFQVGWQSTLHCSTETQH